MNLILATLALLIPLVQPAAQTNEPVCEMVSEADAAAVIGPVEEKQSILGPDQCIFSVPGLSLSIHRMANQEPDALQGLLQLPRRRARAEDVVKDEPGIGEAAVSEAAKGRLGIIAAAGSTAWIFRVDGVYSKDLSEMMPTLRELAKKVVGGGSK